jgi:hypothetical protein
MDKLSGDWAEEKAKKIYKEHIGDAVKDPMVGDIAQALRDAYTAGVQYRDETRESKVHRYSA